MSDHSLFQIAGPPDSARRRALQQLLGAMAAAAWAPALAGVLLAQTHDGHSTAPAAKPGTRKRRPLATGRPSFFGRGEFRTLGRVVDLILPRTETPGAVDAGVPLYIDIVAGEDPKLGARLRRGLAALDAAARSAVGRQFTAAREADQIRMLEVMLPASAPGNEFFEAVKAMTLVGYYSSEIGLYEELHFVGNQVVMNFVGCPHGGHPPAVPPPGPRRAAVPQGIRAWPFPGADDILGENP